MSGGFHGRGVLSHGTGEHFADNILVFSATLHLHLLLLDFDETLDDQLLEEHGVVG